MVANLLIPFERDAVGCRDGGYDPAMHQRHVGPSQIERRKRFVQLRNERGDLRLRRRRLVRAAHLRGLPGSEQRPAPPRDQEQVAARRRASAERGITGVAPRDQVHRLEHREAGREAGRAEQAIDGAARRIHDCLGRDLECAARESIDTADARDSPSLFRHAEGFDVIGEHRAVGSGRERPAEGQAIGLGRDVVVPDGGASQAAAAQSRKLLDGVLARDHPPGRKAQRRDHVAVAAGGHDPVDEKAGAHREASPGHGSVEGQRERHRGQGMRRDARERAPFTHRFARARQIEVLQVAQAAVDRPQVIEGAA